MNLCNWASRPTAEPAKRRTAVFSILLGLVCLLLLPAAGCGKSEYEQRMDRRMSQLRSPGGSQADDASDRQADDPAE
jgi:hypothetical protein